MCSSLFIPLFHSQAHCLMGFPFPSPSRSPHSDPCLTSEHCLCTPGSLTVYPHLLWSSLFSSVPSARSHRGATWALLSILPAYLCLFPGLVTISVDSQFCISSQGLDHIPVIYWTSPPTDPAEASNSACLKVKSCLSPLASASYSSVLSQGMCRALSRDTF